MPEKFEIIRKDFMKAEVPQDLLKLGKEIMDHHCHHDTHCSIHMTEFCDCGLTERFKRYRALLREVKI
jgi:hypothetical protein